MKKMNPKYKKILSLFVISILSLGVLGCKNFDQQQSIPMLPSNSARSDIEIISIANYSFGGSSSANGMHVVGNHAYIAMNGELMILDISNPLSPTYISNVTTPIGMDGDVHVVGDYACVAGTTVDFSIINISDPLNPALLDQHNEVGSAWGIYAETNYAYVAWESDGLGIINFTDPTNVTKIGFYDDPTGLPYDVQVVGNYAYVADGSGGLEILDISDPTAPTQVSQTTNTTDQARGVYVDGDYAYLADWAKGMRIFDVSNPAYPVELWTSDTNNGYEVYVEGNFAYLTDNGFERLVVYDIRNKLNPFFAGEYTTNKYLIDIEVKNGYIYALGGDKLFILQGTEVQHSISVLNPDLNEKWYTTNSYNITWNSIGNDMGGVHIELYLDGVFESRILAYIANDGIQEWTVPSDLESSSLYQFKILDLKDDDTFGMSYYFEITEEPEDKKIPGYDTLLILGVLGVSVSVLMYHKKREKK